MSRLTKPDVGRVLKWAWTLLIVLLLGSYTSERVRAVQVALKAPPRIAPIRDPVAEGLDLSLKVQPKGKPMPASRTSAPEALAKLPIPDDKHCSWDPYNGADVDTYLIHYGVATHTTFASTLRWWIGPWGPGELQIPGYPKGARCLFYRPVSSTFFWLEWRTLGYYEDRYEIWNQLLAIPFVLCFLWATNSLVKRFRPNCVGKPSQPFYLLVCLYMLVDGWGINLPALVSHSLVIGVPGTWKNLPDLLTATLSLLAIVGYVAAGERGKGWWKHALWIVPLFLACASKEVVLLLPAALPLLDLPLWQQVGDDQAKRPLRARLWLALGFLLAFNVFRLAVLGGTGYQYGHNSIAFMLRRFVSSATYPWGMTLIRHDYLDLIAYGGLILAIVGLAWWYRRARGRLRSVAVPAIGLGLWLVVLAVSVVAVTRDPEDPMAIALPTGLCLLAQQLDHNPHATIVMVGTPLLFWLLLRRQPQWLLACAAWVILTATANMFSPSPLHREFVPSVGWAWLWGMATATLLADVCRPGVEGMLSRHKLLPRMSSD